MNKKDFIFIFLLFCIAFFSRILFLEKMQSHWDGPQYSIAVVQYDLLQETPAPPGYPFYIGLGTFFNTTTNDPHKALLLLGVIFSGLAAVIFYWVGNSVFNRTVGIIAALLFISGPTFYFFGLTAYPYGLTPFIVTSFAYLVYLIVVREKQFGFLLGIAFGVVIGFRPQDLLFMTPLFLYGFYHLENRQRLLAIGGFGFTNLLWFIPVTQSAGGIKEYLNILFPNNKLSSLNGIAKFPLSEIIMTFAKGIFLSFGIASLFLVLWVFLLKKKQKYHRKKFFKNKLVVIFTLWFLPSFLFNLFIRSDHAGHQMTYLSALLLLVAYVIWQTLRKKKELLVILMLVIVLFNLFTFFRDRDPGYKKQYVPTSFHYSEIQKNDRQLSEKILYISRHFSTQNSIIITSPDQWRPTMYYLKKYPVYTIEKLFVEDSLYGNLIRKGRNWNFTQTKPKNDEIIMPRGIKHLIFTDSLSSDWSVGKKTVITLPFNTVITVIPITAGLYKYSYHSFNLQN